MARSVFDYESEERAESLEQLSAYIRIARPSVWVIFAALALVFVALLIWGFTGSIPDTRTYWGVVDEATEHNLNVVMDAYEFPGSSVVGQQVTYRLSDGARGTGTVTQASERPMSRQELADLLKNDFLSDTLIDSDYSYLLAVKPNEDLNAHHSQIADVTIILEAVPPISFLLN